MALSAQQQNAIVTMPPCWVLAHNDAFEDDAFEWLTIRQCHSYANVGSFSFSSWIRITLTSSCSALPAHVYVTHQDGTLQRQPTLHAQQHFKVETHFIALDSVKGPALYTSKTYQLKIYILR